MLKIKNKICITPPMTCYCCGKQISGYEEKKKQIKEQVNEEM